MSRKYRVYLDCCCYNRPFDDQDYAIIRLETEAKLHIQAGIRRGDYELCWSFVLDYENRRNPYDYKRDSIAAWKRIACVFCRATDIVLQRSQEIMRLGVKELDALHVACAIEGDCDYLITTDKGILNKHVDGIIVINPIDFVRKMEGY